MGLVLAYLKTRGWTMEIYQTGAERALANYHGSAHMVIAAGGDGTFNEVIDGLAKSEPKVQRMLAIIPLGTTNVMASELHLPSNAKDLAELIDSGNSCECFWPKANDRCFPFLSVWGLMQRLSKVLVIR